MPEHREYDPRIEAIMADMCKSTDGRRICEWVRENVDNVVFDSQIENTGYYYFATNSIHLNPRKPNEALAIVLAHEARHAWQTQQGIIGLGVLRNGTCDDYIYLCRLAEADAYREMVMFAYRHSQDTETSTYLDALGRSKCWYFAHALHDLVQSVENADEMMMNRCLFDAFFEAGNPIFDRYNESLAREAKATALKQTDFNPLYIEDLIKLGQDVRRNINYLASNAHDAGVDLKGARYTQGLAPNIQTRVKPPLTPKIITL